MHEVWGPYRIVRALGQGAMGRVFVAVDQGSQLAVALKLVALGSEHDHAALDAARGRFLAEAHATRCLQHPHIAAVLDAGEARGQGWLAMELVPGTDLSRYTRPARLLPEALVLHVGACIARALAHAHAAGIVHRDVKPSNVLVDWASNTIKLSDFGLARTADAQATRTGVVLGSPAFLAPEQLAGAEAEPRSDLYALGVTLFQLLSGSLPFAAASMGELLRQVANDVPPSLRELKPEIKPELSAETSEIVAALLHKQPAQRPHSAERLADRLEALAATLR